MDYQILINKIKEELNNLYHIEGAENFTRVFKCESLLQELEYTIDIQLKEKQYHIDTLEQKNQQNQQALEQIIRGQIS